MSLPQRKFREIVFQLLYSIDFNREGETKELIKLIMHELKVTKKAVSEAQIRIDDLLKYLSVIDKKITEVSVSYEFARIQRAERNILRLGVYELCYDDGIPAKVVISEAVRLARKFCTREAANFVNAILDAVYKIESGEGSDSNELALLTQDLEESESVAQDAARELETESVRTNSDELALLTQDLEEYETVAQDAVRELETSSDRDEFAQDFEESESISEEQENFDSDVLAFFAEDDDDDDDDDDDSGELAVLTPYYLNSNYVAQEFEADQVNSMNDLSVGSAQEATEKLVFLAEGLEEPMLVIEKMEVGEEKGIEDENSGECTT